LLVVCFLRSLCGTVVHAIRSISPASGYLRQPLFLSFSLSLFPAWPTHRPCSHYTSFTKLQPDVQRKIVIKFVSLLKHYAPVCCRVSVAKLPEREGSREES
ncbi:hypothetical protein BGY98DRAFT_1000933, partial [Russula aff. rugulosa BPL654]